MTRQARELGRWDWVLEEHRLRYGPDARFVTEPEEAWRKLKGQGTPLIPGADGAARGRRLARAWRRCDATARPPGSLRTGSSLDIAKRKPADNREGLSRVRGLDEKMRDREAASCSQAVAAGSSRSPIEPAAPMRPDLAQRLAVLAALGQLLVGVRADAAGLAAPLIATRDDVESFVAARTQRQRPADFPLGSGWRKELAGDALAALADGRLALAPSPEPPYLVEIDRPAVTSGAPRSGGALSGHDVVHPIHAGVRWMNPRPYMARRTRVEALEQRLDHSSGTAVALLIRRRSLEWCDMTAGSFPAAYGDGVAAD